MAVPLCPDICNRATAEDQLESSDSLLYETLLVFKVAFHFARTLGDGRDSFGDVVYHGFFTNSS